MRLLAGLLVLVTLAGCTSNPVAPKYSPDIDRAGGSQVIAPVAPPALIVNVAADRVTVSGVAVPRGDTL